MAHNTENDEVISGDSTDQHFATQSSSDRPRQHTSNKRARIEDVTPNRPSPTGKPTKAYAEFFLSERFSDMAISVGDQIFSTHRIVVCSQSTGLETALAETEDNVVHIDDETPEDVYGVFQYLYTGGYERTTGKDNTMARLAIKYGIVTLEQGLSGSLDVSLGPPLQGERNGHTRSSPVCGKPPHHIFWLHLTRHRYGRPFYNQFASNDPLHCRERCIYNDIATSQLEPPSHLAPPLDYPHGEMDDIELDGDDYIAVYDELVFGGDDLAALAVYDEMMLDGDSGYFIALYDELVSGREPAPPFQTRATTSQPTQATSSRPTQATSSHSTQALTPHPPPTWRLPYTTELMREIATRRGRCTVIHPDHKLFNVYSWLSNQKRLQVVPL
ncbi:hypothetical protein BJ508DRAFT_331863 [Ascobolus immersus RN42]|uniref:BTB domain-containing protein n=1 Tax=Ascobolus immersus RN42 TaxID=1160509 RepID=A0A3N4HUJ8_ASCIM|nr:hypothetical protein BJ508DRAFT_331863 [Ascobolus immersus RN42]